MQVGAGNNDGQSRSLGKCTSGQLRTKC